MKHCYWTLWLIGLAVSVSACGQAKNTTGPSPSAKSDTPPSTAVESGSLSSSGAPSATSTTETSSVSESASTGTPIEGPTGRIEGTVTFVGDEIPQSTVVSNTTDPQICGAALSKRDVEISADTRGIRYVLVWLEGVKLPEDYKPPTQTLVLDNVKCQFEPHAAVITTGSVIETRNSDEVYHTTNLRGKVTKENIPLVARGTKFQTKVRTAELVYVSCDKHGWMQSFIRVDPHPFHAVTDADGRFSIAGVPVGTYKLKIFHEKFYAQEHEVTVAENAAASLELKYPTQEQK